MKTLLKYLLIAISILHVATAKAQPNNLKIIRLISVSTDYEQDGVQGINITYKYNFLPLEELLHNDSILNKASFKITTKLFLKDEAINPAYGYQDLANNKNELVYTTTFKATEIKATKLDKSIDVFIPYAALKLPDSAISAIAIYPVTIQAEIAGTDGTGKKYAQKIEKQHISFYKPATQTVTIVIDNIEVNTLNAKGRAWDYSFFGKDAPDIGVAIKIASTIVWQKYFNNVYLFTLQPSANSISFTISKNDKITLLVEDRDWVVHDLIASIDFKTDEAKAGVWQYYTTANGNIKSCKISFKVE